MYLIQKGKKPIAICRDCKALHAARDCPYPRFPQPVTMRTLRARDAAEFMADIYRAKQLLKAGA